MFKLSNKANAFICVCAGLFFCLLMFIESNIGFTGIFFMELAFAVLMFGLAIYCGTKKEDGDKK